MTVTSKTRIKTAPKQFQQRNIKQQSKTALERNRANDNNNTSDLKSRPIYGDPLLVFHDKRCEKCFPLSSAQWPWSLVVTHSSANHGRCCLASQLRPIRAVQAADKGPYIMPKKNKINSFKVWDKKKCFALVPE